MYLGMSCIWICHVLGYVMYLGMPCIFVSVLSLFLLDFGNIRQCGIIFFLNLFISYAMDKLGANEGLVQ
jgi:hypothetical protein